MPAALFSLPRLCLADHLLNAGGNLAVDRVQVLRAGVLGRDDGEIGQTAAHLPHQPPFAPVTQTGAAEYCDKPPGAPFIAGKRAQCL